MAAGAAVRTSKAQYKHIGRRKDTTFLLAVEKPDDDADSSHLRRKSQVLSQNFESLMNPRSQ